MGFLLTAALVLQTFLGNAAGEGQKSYDSFDSWNFSFYLYDNYSLDYALENSTGYYYYYSENDTYDYSDFKTSTAKAFTESAGLSLQGHHPFFFVLLHLLFFATTIHTSFVEDMNNFTLN